MKSNHHRLPRYQYFRPLRGPAALCSVLLSGCASTSTGMFEPASTESARITTLFWVMAVGGGLIWLIVIGAAVYASRLRPRSHDRRRIRRLLLGGGVGFPVIVLTALMIYGLRMLGEPVSRQTAMQIEITGEQWWWRVAYQRPGPDPVHAANEIRLPVDEPVTLVLRTRDVIHSLWVPALSGKLDMLPGRENRLVVQPDRIGLFRGYCAEYCGTSHANMGIMVEVMERDTFQAWLAHEELPATEVRDSLHERGQALFASKGCDLCHAIRGTPARGDVGPDLTHVAGRHAIAGGILPQGHDSLKRWIEQADALKPRALMPSYPLPDRELDALAAYLGQLR